MNLVASVGRARFDCTSTADLHTPASKPGHPTVIFCISCRATAMSRQSPGMTRDRSLALNQDEMERWKLNLWSCGFESTSILDCMSPLAASLAPDPNRNACLAILGSSSLARLHDGRHGRVPALACNHGPQWPRSESVPCRTGRSEQSVDRADVAGHFCQPFLDVVDLVRPGFWLDVGGGCDSSTSTTKRVTGDIRSRCWP